MSGFLTMNSVITYLLTSYLAQNGLTVVFIIHIKKRYGNDYLTIREFVEIMLRDGIKPKSFFYKAFRWDTTDQGKDYWHKHELGWMDYLNRVRSALEGR